MAVAVRGIRPVAHLPLILGMLRKLAVAQRIDTLIPPPPDQVLSCGRGVEALVLALADEHGVILAGDFNDMPGSRTLGLLKEAGYADAPKLGSAATWPSPRPRTEIDYVLYRPSYAFSGSAQVLEEAVASDHRPVLAELLWVHAK